MRESEEKVRSLEEVRADLASVRARGDRVVLANGIFDLIHVGHVRYLCGAAREGDFLVVAVNGDESARTHKGPGRPFLPATERAEIVAAMGCVDRVVVFEQLDVVEVLKALRPDVHAKGTDYTPETVPEREVAASIGTRTAIVGDPKNHSTTDLLRMIHQSAGRSP